MSYTIYNPSTAPYTGNLTLGPYTYTSGTSATTYDIFSPGGSNGTWSATSTPVTISQKATIDLKGDEADIIINGESLNATLKEIKNALRIPGKLAQNEQLEKDWEELQAAADHYNKLLAEYKDKQKVWDILKDDDL